ncbi:MAG: MarR family transcriptional regulator [Flavobacteriaceae bacterium]|jgi:DNA-binding MarR family transcriptional regulator|nr:MarR family transcriptional regulator [Flavobacteriaceae bacterium]
MNIEDIIKTENQLPASRRLIISLFSTTSWATEQISEVLKPYEISLPQFNVLRILRGQKGKPANLSTIQERMVNKMSNTTRLVDKLISKNLVERITCEKNRRKVEITITSEGLSFLKKLDSVMDEIESEITQNLSEIEIQQLTQLLYKLRQ